jgi:hypothetical protein
MSEGGASLHSFAAEPASPTLERRRLANRRPL